VIRQVTSEDVPDVIRIVADTLAEFGLEFGQGSSTDDELRDLPSSYALCGGAFWVAHHDGALVGTCGMYPVKPKLYELRKMYLRPASRGLGLGKRLLDHALDWTRARGGTHVVLDTMEKMTRAIAFYEQHGFVRDDAQIRGTRCSRGYIRAL
jgi:putative acetyltransferase